MAGLPKKNLLDGVLYHVRSHNTSALPYQLKQKNYIQKEILSCSTTKKKKTTTYYKQKVFDQKIQNKTDNFFF